MREVIELERLQMGVALMVSDVLAKSLEIESVRESMLRATQYSITGFFMSNKLFEETQVSERVLTWRERLRALLGKPIAYKTTVQMRRNCPHLPSEPEHKHLNFMLNEPDMRWLR